MESYLQWKYNGGTPSSSVRGELKHNSENGRSGVQWEWNYQRT